MIAVTSVVRVPSRREGASVVGEPCLLPAAHPREAFASERVSLSAAELALGLRMLGDLLDAGLTIRRALGALRTLAPGPWRDAIPALDRSLREGRSLAAALAEAPIVVPAVVVGIVAAGEAGSGTPDAVRRAAELMERAAAAQASLRAALAYPAVLALSALSTICLMVGVVLPRFANLLADFNQALPWSTQLLFRAAAVGQRMSLPALAVVTALLIGVRTWTATSRGRRQWHAALLRLPYLGSLRFATATARAALTLSALLDAGVPIRRSLGFAAQASGDAELEARLLVARDGIARGEGVGQAFAASEALTSVAVRLAGAGEEGGRLAEMLRHAAALEQARADRLVKVGVQLLEPALMLVFAGVVGLVAAALLQAVYSVRPT